VKGSTYKRCGCLDEDGKQLGARCPKLRRRDGSWNPRHRSTWYYQVSYPGRDGKRVQHPVGGFATEPEAQAALERRRRRSAAG